jgi:amidase
VFPLLGIGTPPELVQHMIDGGVGKPADDYSARAARALQMRHYEYVSLTARRAQLYRQWRSFFDRYDVLVCPSTPVVATMLHPGGDLLPDPVRQGLAWGASVNGSPTPYWDRLQWPALASVANLPSTAIPIDRRVDGLPMGVQVIGPYLEDRTPLRFAQLVEGALGGFTAPPSFI